MASKGELVVSALSERDMPTTGWREFAFMGRSNAGKSSLINRLAGRKIAHTSGTPGRTQRINFFAMDGWYIVDLPGFGYARVSKSQRAIFGEAVEQYLTGRQPLLGGVLIQDVRRDPEDEEYLVQKWARERNVYLIIVASKIDKLNQTEKANRQAVLDRAYGESVVLASSRTGEGIDLVKSRLKAVGMAV